MASKKIKLDPAAVALKKEEAVVWPKPDNVASAVKKEEGGSPRLKKEEPGKLKKEEDYKFCKEVKGPEAFFMPEDAWKKIKITFIDDNVEKTPKALAEYIAKKYAEPFDIWGCIVTYPPYDRQEQNSCFDEVADRRGWECRLYPCKCWNGKTEIKMSSDHVKIVQFTTNDYDLLCVFFHEFMYHYEKVTGVTVEE